MILYGSTLSFFVRKAAAFAHEKGINFDLKGNGRDDHDPEFRKASPFGKMPALVDGDYYLSDSSAIIHYLDALHPEPELIPGDPRLRGRTIWFEEWADTMLGACARDVFFNRIVAPRFLGRDGDLEAADKAERDALPPLLTISRSKSLTAASSLMIGSPLPTSPSPARSPIWHMAGSPSTPAAIPG